MPESAILKSVLPLINDDSKVLQVAFGSQNVKPGEKVPKGRKSDHISLQESPSVCSVYTSLTRSPSEAQGIPTIAWNGTSAQKLIVICLDVDAPFPSFAPLSPALHWLQDSFTASSNGELVSSEPAIAFWAGPGPPPISGPHRYIFLLYEQPADFDAKLFVKASGYGIRDRMRWNFSKFEKQAKLGSAVAATYFLSN